MRIGLSANVKFRKLMPATTTIYKQAYSSINSIPLLPLSNSLSTPEK
ncbi:MAG: hypothetical protein IIU50_02140 [Bacteroidaceae bacterium]|nr:hypothetical protein [Bacteroidaceae bacterium]